MASASTTIMSAVIRRTLPRSTAARGARPPSTAMIPNSINKTGTSAGHQRGRVNMLNAMKRATLGVFFAAIFGAITAMSAVCLFASSLSAPSSQSSSTLPPSSARLALVVPVAGLQSRKARQPPAQPPQVHQQHPSLANPQNREDGSSRKLVSATPIQITDQLESTRMPVGLGNQQNITDQQQQQQQMPTRLEDQAGEADQPVKFAHPQAVHRATQQYLKLGPHNRNLRGGAQGIDAGINAGINAGGSSFGDVVVITAQSAQSSSNCGDVAFSNRGHALELTQSVSNRGDAQNVIQNVTARANAQIANAIARGHNGQSSDAIDGRGLNAHGVQTTARGGIAGKNTHATNNATNNASNNGSNNATNNASNNASNTQSPNGIVRQKRNCPVPTMRGLARGRGKPRSRPAKNEVCPKREAEQRSSQRSSRTQRELARLEEEKDFCSFFSNFLDGNPRMKIELHEIVGHEIGPWSHDHASDALVGRVMHEAEGDGRNCRMKIGRQKGGEKRKREKREKTTMGENGDRVKVNDGVQNKTKKKGNKGNKEGDAKEEKRAMPDSKKAGKHPQGNKKGNEKGNAKNSKRENDNTQNNNTQIEKTIVVANLTDSTKLNDSANHVDSTKVNDGRKPKGGFPCPICPKDPHLVSTKHVWATHEFSSRQ